MQSSNDIRQSFLDYFEERGHHQIASAPLVPQDDPTLLFVNAGMVQFKDWFTGAVTPEVPRAVTSQKCLRVSGKHNDLENVGPSPRHHTFFEMLGNFSFGDYFKAEAIEFGWDLVTRVWGLDPDHLFATVFREDDEAAELWAKISSLPPERINRCGEKDNFWAMGDTGPCGPCSEIFVDLFPETPKVPFGEGEGSGRYVEIWNLVFMQFERSLDGSLEPLPNPSIDTGSGLERVAAVLQGVKSNYDTDLFQPILHAAAASAGTGYGQDASADVSLRVIADHLRASAFLLADGVIPANDGRGYVLRRLLRRAVRHGMRLGFEEPFVGSLLPVLGDVMGSAYPQLEQTRAASLATITAEEEKFLTTVASGAQKVQEAIEEARARGEDTLTGATVFHFYDTRGLPIDVLREIAEEEQFEIDEDGFVAELEAARERSRAAGGSNRVDLGAVRALMAPAGSGAGLPETEFLGYAELVLSDEPLTALVRLAQDGELAATDTLTSGETGFAAIARSVFYGESGGQVGDRGELEGPNGRAVVLDVQRQAGLFLLEIAVTEGTLATGEPVTQRVDRRLRRDTERHHTATHLLHAALRERLGEGVRQAGSLVHPERLRFDFTHGSPLQAEDREEVERLVNEWVRRAVPIAIAERSYQEAVDAGAMALFGEKYGAVVRTVEVPGFSLELCGGCHVPNSGTIGEFVITGERGIASGVRRIEALAGSVAEEWRRLQSQYLHAALQELGTSAENAAAEVGQLKDRLKEQERELSKMRMKLMSGGSSSEDDGEAVVEGVRVLTREVPEAPAGELRNLADVLRGRLGSGVVVLGVRGDAKVNLIAAVSSDLTDRINAGQLVRSLASLVGGSGGGRADFAQAGGKLPEKLDEALAMVPEAVREQVTGETGEGATT